MEGEHHREECANPCQPTDDHPAIVGARDQSLPQSLGGHEGCATGGEQSQVAVGQREVGPEHQAKDGRPDEECPRGGDGAERSDQKQQAAQGAPELDVSPPAAQHGQPWQERRGHGLEEEERHERDHPPVQERPGDPLLGWRGEQLNHDGAAVEHELSGQRSHQQ